MPKKKPVKTDKAKAQVGLIQKLKIPESGVPHSAKLISVCSLSVYEVRRLIHNMPQHIHGWEVTNPTLNRGSFFFWKQQRWNNDGD